MKVAFITPLVIKNPTSGSELRYHQFQEILQRITLGNVVAWDLHRSCEIDLFTESTDTKLDQLPHQIKPTIPWQRSLQDSAALLCYMWPFFTIRTLFEQREQILAWVRREKPTHIVLHHSASELLPALRQMPLQLFVDCHSVESDLARQMIGLAQSIRERQAALLRWATVKRWEKRLLPLADEIWLPSQVDVRRQQQVCSSLKRLRCVPNGLDIHKYQLHHQSRSHDLVLPASFRYEPNVVGAQILRDDVLPAVRQVIPDARLVLLGRDPLGMAKALQREPDVVATGEVASTQSFFLSAGVIAVPLFQGGGTRYKILEALALGCPVVTTPLGCEGLEVRNGEHLLIRDINDFSSAIIALLSDSSTSTALGHRGRRLVEAYYSWEAVEAQVRNALSTERHGQPPSHPQSTLIRGQ